MIKAQHLTHKIVKSLNLISHITSFDIALNQIIHSLTVYKIIAVIEHFTVTLSNKDRNCVLKGVVPT